MKLQSRITCFSDKRDQVAGVREFEENNSLVWGGEMEECLEEV